MELITYRQKLKKINLCIIRAFRRGMFPDKNLSVLFRHKTLIFLLFSSSSCIAFAVPCREPRGGGTTATLPLLCGASYALGEAGPAAAGHVADKVGELLDDPLESVVRVVADALCCIPTFSAVTVARIHRHLIQKNLQWQVKAMGEGVSKVSGNWTVENQIRYVCTWALLVRVSMDNPPQEIEAALIDALGDETGFTQGIATEGWKRLGTNSALRAAVDFLQVHRWDNLQQRYFREDAEAAIN